MPTIFPPTLEELLTDGRRRVSLHSLDEPYPQPELDRAAFVRQVKGFLPKYLWEYVDFDPFGVSVFHDTAETTDFLFPNSFGRVDKSDPPEGVLEPARHVVTLHLPRHSYPVHITFSAHGIPGKPATWKATEYLVAGLDYRAENLPVAVALSTGDYPKGAETR